MAKLSEFLKTGTLGPLTPGMDPFTAISFLGEPDEESNKKNPLVLRYGSLQLVFWKHEFKSQLRDITLSFLPEFESVPTSVQLEDFPTSSCTTLKQFRNFMFEIRYNPAHLLEQQNGWIYTFLSGVSVEFTDDLLSRVRFSQKEDKDKSKSILSDVREPSLFQINEMISEALMTASAGALRSALVMAWAALEAAFRRKALELGMKGQIGVQANNLIRELVSAGVISQDERRLLEELRQLRTASVHGLAPVDFTPSLVNDAIKICNKLLNSAEQY